MKQKQLEKIIFILVALLVILVPAVFSVSFKSSFAAPKLLVLSFLTIALTGVCAYYLVTKKSVKSNSHNWEKHLRTYIAIALIGSLFSINLHTSFFGIEGRFLGTFTLIHLGLLAIIILRFFPKNKTAHLLTILWGVGLIMALYSFAQYHGLIEFENVRWDQNPRARAFGTFGHANHLGAFLATVFAVTIGLIGYYKNKWKKLGLALSLLILLGGVGVSASRGAFAALIITMIFLGILISHIHRKKKKLALVTITIILALSILITAFPSSQKTLKELPMVKRSIQTLEILQSGQQIDRISWWKSSFSMIFNNPVFGTGFATFKDTYNQYRRTDYQVPGDIQDTITPESAHNEFINTWATQGTLGLVAYLLMVFYLFWQLLKSIWRQKPDKETYLAIGILGGITIYIVQTQISFGVISSLTILYILFGLGALLLSNKKEVIKHKKLATLLLAMIFIFGSIYINGKRGMAEYYSQMAASSLINEEAESYHEKTIKYFPWEQVYHSNYADYALQSILLKKEGVSFQKYIALAENYYKKALNINEHSPFTWGNYATALLVKSNRHLRARKIYEHQETQEASFKAFETAIEKGPNNPIFPYYYARALDSLGMQKDAKLQYQAVQEIRPNFKGISR